MDGMSVGLIRYDAARRALAAACRVDEVKKIHDKAVALLAYAKQAGDLTLQNQAAEIRILAERRAGQLLVNLEEVGQRQTRERGRPPKASQPVTLSKVGITRNQSSKWQRMARLIDDATFEEALSRAKDTYGELTTAGLLRMLKVVVRPKGRDVEPDINVIAAELARELDSPNRRERLEQVVRLRARLNPTLRRQLIASLKNASEHLNASRHSLSADFKQPPSNGKAHQRLIREHMATQPEADLEEKQRLASDFKNATVREISYDEAKNVIMANEWLGNLGTTEWAYGLFFGRYLAGVACFGSTAGTNVAASICGAEHRHKVITLCRGANLFWAHPHSASFLITAACKEMTKKGYHIFVAYSDPGPVSLEIGSVYQATGWSYCSTTNPPEQFRPPDGKIHDSRQVSGLARDRRGGTLKYKRTRAEQKKLLLEQGCEFFEGTPKHRYVGIYGDRRTKRILRSALKWPVLPYPKRPNASPQPARIGSPVAAASSGLAATH
jgi:uncharacterized protein YggU (UPF0235/DUF167 family)